MRDTPCSLFAIALQSARLMWPLQVQTLVFTSLKGWCREGPPPVLCAVRTDVAETTSVITRIDNKMPCSSMHRHSEVLTTNIFHNR